MPRKKTEKPPVLGQQVYQLPQFGPHAKVTIDYDASAPPPFFQPGPSVVIIGEHECQPLFQSSQRSGQVYEKAGGYDEPARGGNLLDENDPRFQQMKAGLRALPTPAAKPVVTSEQIFAEAGIKLDGPLDFGALAAAAAGSTPVSEE